MNYHVTRAQQDHKMAWKFQIFVIVAAVFCINFTMAHITCYDDEFITYTCNDDEICCGADSCCDPDISFWSVWYFWLLLIFGIAIVSSCVGCCVRAARNEQARRYYRITNNQPPVYGTVVVATASTPPPYPGPPGTTSGQNLPTAPPKYAAY